jgi:nicotinate-nucleotide pyrophosphorylase (carboxylating)
MMGESINNRLIRLALKEDIGNGDITTAALGLSGRKGAAIVVAKAEGVIAGIDRFTAVFRLLSPRVSFRKFTRDGGKVTPKMEVIRIAGPLVALLTGERTAMNILSHLSGVATLTAKFAERVRDYPVKILDTRKTMPGMRAWEKAAVRLGGGANHRQGLYDMYLIKENHIAAAGDQLAALNKVLKHRKKTGAKIEIEVRNIAELKRIINSRPDFILLDNFSLGDLKKAVALVKSHGGGMILEASGNINLRNAARVAATGVDRISVGALTHSAPALDLSFRVLD